MAEFIPVDPFDIVIFGGTGDLARRKLLTSLYHRDRDNQLSEDSRIIGVSRSELTQSDYARLAEESLAKHLPADEIDAQVL